MLDQTSVEAGIRDIVRDTLTLDDADLAPSTRFFADAGGESIELLELGFRIEKRFGVRVDFSQMLAPGQIVTDQRGIVAPEALRRLKDTYPFLAVESLGPAPTPESLKDLLTFDAITQLVKRTLADQRAPE